MNTPGVGDAVRTAETEMTLFPLIVAAEPLIDVVVVVTPIGQRAKRNIAFVGKHIGSAAVIRSDGRFLTVQIGGIVNIDKHVLDANMAGIVCPERISGEPGFQLVDVRDGIVAGHGPFQSCIGQPGIVDIQRSAARVVDRDIVHNRNFGVNISIRPVEFQKERDIIIPGVGGVGIADRGSDGVFLVLAEVDRDVADIFFDSRNIIGAVTVVQSDRRSGAAPAAGNIDRNVRHREIPQVGEINQIVLKVEICRTHFTQAPVRHIDGNVVNPRIEIPGSPDQTRNIFIRPVENKFLRNVPDLALNAVVAVLGKAERIIAVGTVIQRRIDFHIFHMQDFREAAVNPVAVAGIARNRIIDDAVANVQHPGIVDVDIGFEAPLRQCSACVFRVVHINALASELAVFKRDAHLIVSVIVEIQHVVVRVDAVPEEIDPVHQEHPQIRKLETTVRDNAFHIGIFRLVRAPGVFCLLRDKVIHQIGRVRHPEKQQICDVGVFAVRDDSGIGF